METLNVSHNHKDRLFRKVFHHQKDLLELYNAVRGTDYQNVEDLNITTLDGAIYLGMKNDISFILDDVLNMYEHQSSICANLPLRGMLYLANHYKKYLDNPNRIYSSKLIRLPIPQYIIFYNGVADQPEREEWLLSEAFDTQGDTIVPCVEFRAIVLNINYGKNADLLENCQKLKEYAQFIDRIRKYQSLGAALETAVESAIAVCIKEDILRDLLSSEQSEVKDMILEEYDEAWHIASEKEISYSEGHEKGHEKGREEGLHEGIHLTKLVLKLNAQGLTVEEIAEHCNVEIGKIQEILEL